ncbi:MAG TPA: hypothetical protein PLA15_07735 [bacterium]|nr:hypothetical protein [bacterium]
MPDKLQPLALEDNAFMLSSFLSRFTFPLLFIFAAAIEFCMVRISGITSLRNDFESLYWHFGIAFGIYLLTVLYVRFYWGKTFFSPEWIIGTAIVFRLTLLFSDPVLSDDIYRYIWDGRVSNHAVNPYAYAPESGNLYGIRDSVIYPQINHKELQTIYPPAAQVLFRITSWISESVLAMKLMVLLFDIGIIFLIMALLRHFELPLGWIAVYAWNPLVIIEFSGNGHMDAIGIFFMLLAFWFSLREKTILSALPLALSFCTKYLTLPLLPFMEDIRSRWKNVLAITAIFAGTVLLLYTGYSDVDAIKFGSLKIFSETWEFNASLYTVVENFFKTRLDSALTTVWGISTDNPARLAARLTIGISLTLFIMILYGINFTKSYAVQTKRRIYYAFLIIAAILIVSPTVHPWYVIWIIPFLCFYPNPAWVLFTGLVFMSYDTLVGSLFGAHWYERPEIKLWQYIPFYAVMIIHFTWYLIRKFQSHPGEPGA